jgi:hypothetical protein
MHTAASPSIQDASLIVCDNIHHSNVSIVTVWRITAWTNLSLPPVIDRESKVGNHPRTMRLPSKLRVQRLSRGCVSNPADLSDWYPRYYYKRSKFVTIAAILRGFATPSVHRFNRHHPPCIYYCARSGR